MTPFSNPSVFTVPNKTTLIQLILFSDDTVFERINETQNHKQIHLNPFSYGKGVMAKGPKKLVSVLFNYFVFEKLLLKLHKNFLVL